MYELRQPVLFSWVDEMGMTQSQQNRLSTNGRYIRAPSGEVLFTLERTNHKELGLIYFATQGEEEFVGVIKDRMLVERIVTYWDDHFDQETTNCSAFASYLTTGKFQPYKHGQVVVSKTMQLLLPRTKIEVGDVICLLYLKERLARSRRNAWRRGFLEVQKARRRKPGFAARLSMATTIFPPELLRTLTRDDLMEDYHFMVCVDHHEGEPVWLSQCGWHDPGDEPVTFVVTKGWYDPYPYLTHGPVFISRRK